MSKSFYAVLTGYVSAVMSVCITTLYGNHDWVQPMFYSLVMLIVLDWLAGSHASRKDKSYNSSTALNALFRTSGLLLLLAFAHRVDIVFDSEPFIFAFVWGSILYPTFQSVMANFVRVGWNSHVQIEWINRLLGYIAQRVESELRHKLERSKQRTADNLKSDLERKNTYDKNN